MLYNLTEIKPKVFMEAAADIEFIAEIEDDFVPRVGESIVYNSMEWRVKDVERNLDTRITFVYVVAPVRDDDDFGYVDC
jgi:hypothetical protein